MVEYTGTRFALMPKVQEKIGRYPNTFGNGGKTEEENTLRTLSDRSHYQSRHEKEKDMEINCVPLFLLRSFLSPRGK